MSGTKQAWDEYDSAAEYVAKRDATGGGAGTELPPMLSRECLALINDDVEAFEMRVRGFAYALANS